MTVTLARSWPRTLALVLVVLTACGSESATKSRGGGGEGGGSGSDELATIAGALATVPASSELDEVDELVWGDVGQAAKIAGLEPPDDPTDLDAVDAYLNALEAFPVDKGVYPLLPEVADAIGGLGMPELVEEEGWSFLDVDHFIERRTSPDSLAVLEGDFDEAALTQALGQPEDGTWVLGDPDHPSPPTPARQWGEPQFLALGGPRLSVSTTADTAEAVHDVAAGQAPTLADEPKLAGLAEALDRQHPYAAMLAWPGPELDPIMGSQTPEQAHAQTETLCAGALPEPTAAAATAIADDGGPVILVALAHGSEDAAAANAAALPGVVDNGRDTGTWEPVNEVVELDGVQTTGKVVIARLRPRDPARAGEWWSLLIRRSPLVSYC